MPILLQLFLTFFKIGAVSFGGGYAMIPLITEEAIAFGLTKEQVMNFIAVAESTPGPIAINMATFIGSSQAGFLGSLLATLGVVLPSFIIILLIAALIGGLLKFAGVNAFIKGIRPVVVGLIIATGITMILSVILSLETISAGISLNWKALVIFSVLAIIFYLYKRFKKKTISPILLILIAAVLGIVFYGLIA
ncbi:MAG: chromate transporter [Clostridia bacterium]|nr:chromate transporter [Clostridia bacterium]